MNPKTIKTLGVATIVTAVGAVAFNALRDRGTAASATDARLIPSLEERVNDVRTIVIDGQDGTLTLNGSAAGWTLAERGGYAANADKARDFLLALRAARRIEEKTSDPEKLGRLGLEAPDAEGSQSKRVTLKDEGGATIATLLVGNHRIGKGGAAQLPGGARPDEQYYVLPESGGPSYLAAGDLNVDARSIGWLDQQFLDVERERIKAIRIIHPDDEVVAAVRPDMDAAEMEVIDVPEGKVAKTPSGTATFLSALARLRFDDVKPADELEWDTNPITTTEFYTEHGLTILMESIELPKEGDPDQKVVWARIRCAVAPEQAPTLPQMDTEEMGPEPAPEDAAEDVADAAEEDSAPTAAELATEAAEISAATAGWAYALPSWKTTAFRARLDRLVEDAPAPEPETKAIEEVQPSDDGAPAPSEPPPSDPPPSDPVKESSGGGAPDSNGDTGSAGGL